MSTAADRLRELRIFSPHNACTFAAEHGGTGVYLNYRAQQNGRAFVSAAWQVIRPGYKTDPGSHWQDHGHKTFLRSTTAEQDAKAWAEERYGITEWAKIPGIRGAWFPAGDAAIIRAAVKAAAR